MSAKEHFDVATHIYTRLRRVSSRTIDVIWMVSNAEYAGEVLKLARATNDAETIRLAERFEQLVGAHAPPAAKTPLFSRTMSMQAAPAAAAASGSAGSAEPDAATDHRYVGSLR